MHAREDTDALLDTLVAAVEEARDAVDGRGRSRSGSASRALVDAAHRRRAHAVHLPLADVAVRATCMAERLGVPVVVDNDANAAMLAEWRVGAARGAPTRCC